MSDKNWQRELTAYIDGELNEADRREVEAALASDPRLVALEKKLRQTVTLVQQVAAPAPAPSLKQSVLARLDDEAPAPSRGWFSWPKLVPVLAAAAAALVFFLRGEDLPPAIVDEEQLMLAQNMEVVEDLDLVGLSSVEDLEVIEQLAALDSKKEATP